jgi:hypothetical protein
MTIFIAGIPCDSDFPRPADAEISLLLSSLRGGRCLFFNKKALINLILFA